MEQDELRDPDGFKVRTCSRLRATEVCKMLAGELEVFTADLLGLGRRGRRPFDFYEVGSRMSLVITSGAD